MAIGRFNLSLTGVQPGGLVYVGGTTFSAASTVSLDNVFSSTYDNYKIVIDLLGSAASADLRFRLRVSGSDASGSTDYRNPTLYNTDNSSTVATVAGAASSFGYCGFVGTSYGHTSMDIVRPNKALPTSMTYQNSLSGFQLWGATRHSVSTSYDGFTIYPASGTITGTLRVYGYRNDNN